MIKRLFIVVVLAMGLAKGWSQLRVNISDVSAHMGNTVTVCGTIVSMRNLHNVKNKPILINVLGRDATEHLDVIISTGENSIAPQPDSILHAYACVTGVPVYFKGDSFIYLKAESISMDKQKIIASPVFKEQEVQEMNTPELLQASHNRSLKRTVIFYTGVNDAAKKELLVRYLKNGHIVGFSQTKKQRTYQILLKDYMDE